MADAEEPAPRPLPDLVGGRYRIVSRLGVGGMGVVYKALDQKLNRSVALKALEDRRWHRPGAAARLRTEALAAASLDHPYVCKVYELVETVTDTYIVMEFVEGETLAAMLKRGVLPLLRTLQFGQEIAEGLGTAHARGLVHRDVKPANVMVTPNGHVKLLDFGVAGADVASTPADTTRAHTPPLTLHGGTPHYMAPEHAAGQPVTARADFFSLGVLLYECLTGSLPFAGSTTFDYVRHVLQSAPKRLDRVAPETPAALVDLVERCLEKTPALRPESAEDIVSELQKIAGALTSPGVSVRTARQVRSSRRFRLVAGAVLAVAVLALGWRLFWPKGLETPTTRILRPLVTSAARETGSRISPDGQWVSFVASEGSATRVLVQRIDGGEPRALSLGEGTPESTVWSPDGRQIACAMRTAGNWLLQTYPAFFGGAPLQSLPLPRDLSLVKLRRWVGRTMYVEVSGPKGVSLQRIDLDDGKGLVGMSDTWKLPNRLEDVDVSPDGRSVAMVLTAGDTSDLFVAGIDGSSLRAVTSDAYFEREPIWNGAGDRIIFQSNRAGQADLWEIDPRSGALNQLTQGEMEKIAESTSPDGSMISLQRLSQDAKLWLWSPDAGAAQQLTHDALSDYSPVLSGNGKTIAFQRSQPTPSRGYTILDTKMVVASFDGRVNPSEARTIGDGYSASLSADGTWLAYLRPSNVPAKNALVVRNLHNSVSTSLSDNAALPIYTPSPVGWASPMTAWTHTGADLFFVDQAGGIAIRRYRATEPQSATAPPLVNTTVPGEWIRDLRLSPDDRELGFLSISKEGVIVRILNLASGAVREVGNLGAVATGGFLHGFLDGHLVLVRRLNLHENLTSDIEVLVSTGSSGFKQVGVVMNVFVSSARLHPERRVIYMTRLADGAQNLTEFSLRTGATRTITQNTLPGVAYSGFEPVGADRLIGVRDERRQDIYLLQPPPASGPGAPARR